MSTIGKLPSLNTPFCAVGIDRTIKTVAVEMDVIFRTKTPLSIVKIIFLGLRQSHELPCASEVTPKYVSKINGYLTEI